MNNDAIDKHKLINQLVRDNKCIPFNIGEKFHSAVRAANKEAHYNKVKYSSSILNLNCEVFNISSWFYKKYYNSNSELVFIDPIDIFLEGGDELIKAKENKIDEHIGIYKNYYYVFNRNKLLGCFDSAGDAKFVCRLLEENMWDVSYFNQNGIIYNNNKYYAFVIGNGRVILLKKFDNKEDAEKEIGYYNNCYV